MIVAAADGSSLNNPGPAGWAWYIDDDTWLAGGWPRGTNNMGELKAVLDVLRATRDADEPLTILCDSQYAINCCTKWIPGWKRKGWRKRDGKPVLNRDLLEPIDEELDGRDVTFEWVKGHAGHAMNEAADQRARAAATAFRDGTPVDHGPGFGRVDRDPQPQEDVPRPGNGDEQERLFDLPERPATLTRSLSASSPTRSAASWRPMRSPIAALWRSLPPLTSSNMTGMADCGREAGPWPTCLSPR